ncbi:hypothetical protein LMG27198_10900 [Methylocystis echinoides]|uniref:Uncharacterized protein n=1 Tax=Methylocystis echinoides TaxID=29468 RepID=A0A9W6GS72_9HYPH|nr:hypothetical protein LMG27198_10900 [Methylocystis echinoides]
MGLCERYAAAVKLFINNSLTLRLAIRRALRRAAGSLSLEELQQHLRILVCNRKRLHAELLLRL